MKSVSELMMECDVGCQKQVTCWGSERTGWISKIWDRVVHFSTFKEFWQVLFLYYNIGQHLLQPEEEFRRIIPLLMQAIRKSKQYEQNIINFTITTLQFLTTQF